MWVRASWRGVLPFLVVAQTASMLNVQPLDGVPIGWRADWSWMLSKWNGATLLLSPVAAAAVVAVTLRHFGPEVQAGLPAGVSRWRPIAHITAAVALQAWAVQSVALGVGAVVCWANAAEASGLTLPWQLMTGPAAVLAAVSAGAVVAVLAPVVWSVPGVLFGMFLAHRLFFWHGFPELFTTESATWMVDGGRPVPAHLAATVQLNLVVAIGLWAGLVLVAGNQTWRSLIALVVCVLATAAALAIYLPFVMSGAMDTYERIP